MDCLTLAPDSTSHSIVVRLQNTSDGSSAVGVTITGLTIAYTRERAAAVSTTATALSTVNAAYSSGKAIEIDGTNAPGDYRVDFPNAAFAAGVNSVTLVVNGPTCFSRPVVVQLVDLTDVVLMATDLANLRDMSKNAVTAGTVSDAAATTLSFVTNLTEATTDHYKNRILEFTSGALAGQGREISGYDGATKKITLSEALTDAPANGVTFKILGYIAP